MPNGTLVPNQTSSSEERPANPSVLRDCEEVSLTLGGALCSPTSPSPTDTTPDSSSGRTCPESSPPRTTPSGVSWEPSAERGVLCSRQGENGRTQVMLLDPKEMSRGGFSMLSGSEWPNDAVVCSLSDVLLTGPIPQKYFLSAKACSGILRRAERRGKTLPPMLEQALRVGAEAATGTTTETPTQP